MYHDITTCALRFCLSPSVNYNPGCQARSQYRPITLPSYLGEPVETPPGTNIFHCHPPYRHSSGLTRRSLDARVLYNIRNGLPGSSTDYVGAVFLMFFQADPEAWDALFHTRDQRLPPFQALARITGINPNKCDEYCRLTGGEQSPQNQHSNLQALLNG